MATEIETFIAAGLGAQRAVNKLLPAPAPRLTPDAICRQCEVVKESLLAIRNAWRLSLLDMTDREAWLLADELETVGRQFYSLANVFRATGGNRR
jgi:hypothetical protein